MAIWSYKRYYLNYRFIFYFKRERKRNIIVEFPRNFFIFCHPVFLPKTFPLHINQNQPESKNPPGAPKSNAFTFLLERKSTNVRLQWRARSGQLGEISIVFQTRPGEQQRANKYELCYIFGVR